MRQYDPETPQAAESSPERKDLSQTLHRAATSAWSQRRHALEQLASGGTALAQRARALLARRPTPPPEEPTHNSIATLVATLGRACWRPLGLGLGVGCSLGLLLSLGLGLWNPENEPRLALAASSAATSAMAPAVWVSSTPLAATEVELDEIVIRPAPVSWQPDAKTGPQIELETRDVVVSGRAVAAVVMLKRTGNTAGRVRVLCRTVPGTATAAEDYESLSTIVQFGDRQAMRTVFVPILQRPPAGESRTFSVTLERAPRGPSLGTVTSTTVTIVGDDDGTPLTP